MRKKQLAIMIAVIMVLLTMPLLGACGAEEEAKPAPTVEKPAPTGDQPAEKPQEKKVMKIGAILDLSGPYASVCKPLHKGIDAYVEYVNKNGGIDGNKVEYLWRDTEHKIPNIIAAYEDLKEEGCLTLYTLSTTMAETLAARINKDGIPTLSQGPSQAAIDPPGYMYLRYPFYPDKFGAWLDWFLEEWKGSSPPKFAILTADFPLGRQMLLPAVTEYLKKKQVPLVATELVPVVPLDTTTQLLRIRDAGADFCFGNHIAPGTTQIMKDLTRLDIKDQLKFGNSTVGTIEDVFTMGGANATEGYTCCKTFALWEEANEAPGIKLAAATWKEKYGEDPPYMETPLIGWCTASTMIEAVRLTLEKVAPKNITPTLVDQYGFRMMKNFSPGVYEGNGKAEGPMNYAELGNAGAAFLRIAGVVDGKVKVLSDWRKVPNIAGLAKY